MREQELDFFVSVVDGRRVSLLLGPFATHEEALGKVEEARERVRELCAARAIAGHEGEHWWAYGTCSLPRGSGRTGRLSEAEALAKNPGVA